MNTSTVLYTNTAQEHWLRDKEEDGGIVLLEDDSLWEISPPDRRKTVRWLRVSTIAVESTQKQGYAYLLKNTMDRETVFANYRGRVADKMVVPPEAA